MKTTFKSRHAAILAVRKAEKAYAAARSAFALARGSDMGEWTRLRLAMEEAGAAGCEIWFAANAQGFWVKSWDFQASNPTRDLIAANMD